MPNTHIENPIINSPFVEPKRHFNFTNQGISHQILPGRREGIYFVPIPKPKSKFDWIAGWEKPLSDDQWTHRPNTILVDSQQLESGEALSDEFRAAAAREIEEFKAEIRERFPGRNADDLTPTDILREVMNTVGKQGKLGEQVKCVVSVSMLTEGWDANTVTHIMGVRAFGTQLLCEQVVGRGLRRMSYEAETQTVIVNGETIEFEAFPVEYAEVYGVPFEFIPTVGNSKQKPPKGETHVHTVEDREDALISFPRVIGYRHRIEAETLTPAFTASSRLVLDTKHIPTITENAPIIGETAIHTLDDLQQRRENEVVFLLAKLVLEKYFRHDNDKTEHAIGGRIQNPVKAWLFPQLLKAVKAWLADYVECKDHTFPQMLLLIELAHTAADRVYQAILAGQHNSNQAAPVLLPILQPHNTLGDTGGISYHTSKDTYQTSDKCHLSHVVKDSNWEETAAKAFEWMPQVKAYVKNVTKLDWYIPYTFGGQERRYVPDFVVKLDDGQGDLLNLIIEVSSERRDDKDAKVDQVEKLWVPAINNDGRFGRWGFLEVKDPFLVGKDLYNLIEESN